MGTYRFFSAAPRLAEVQSPDWDGRTRLGRFLPAGGGDGRRGVVYLRDGLLCYYLDGRPDMPYVTRLSDGHTVRAVPDSAFQRGPWPRWHHVPYMPAGGGWEYEGPATVPAPDGGRPDAVCLATYTAPAALLGAAVAAAQ